MTDLIRCNVWVNQVGYLPYASKIAVIEDGSGIMQAGDPFYVVNTEVDSSDPEYVAKSGTLASVTGDFGTYLTADFSTLVTPGVYQVVVFRTTDNEKVCSYFFTISETVYADIIQDGTDFYGTRRCGNSTTGYNTPCHLDDAMLPGGLVHVDLTGGWHGGAGLDKWLSSHCHSVRWLLATRDLTISPTLLVQIKDEVKWGNDYLLKNIAPEGYLYIPGIGDAGNVWTDNVSDNEDDRVTTLDEYDWDLFFQYMFIAAEAGMYLLYQTSDPTYAAQCLTAATNAWTYVTAFENTPDTPIAFMEFGTGILAGLRMYQATGTASYLTAAAASAAALIALQSAVVGETVGGFFPYVNFQRFYPDSINITFWEYEVMPALCDLAAAYPDHEDYATWIAAIQSYCEDFLTPMSALNAFGIVPSYAQVDESFPRQYDGVGYRYFYHPATPIEHNPWKGNNTFLMSEAITLVRAARLLDKPELADIAQRQLDWILGVNPYGFSFVLGHGREPPEYYYGGFSDPTAPYTHGGVQNGIGGDADDVPMLLIGNWKACEFDTMRVCLMMTLLSELTDYYPHAYTLAEWQAGTGQDGGSIGVDPQFTVPGTDYHLKGGSPCLSKGENLIEDYPTALAHTDTWPTGIFGKTRVPNPEMGAYKSTSTQAVVAEVTRREMAHE